MKICSFLIYNFHKNLIEKKIKDFNIKYFDQEELEAYKIFLGEFLIETLTKEMLVINRKYAEHLFFLNYIIKNFSSKSNYVFFKKAIKKIKYWEYLSEQDKDYIKGFSEILLDSCNIKKIKKWNKIFYNLFFEIIVNFVYGLNLIFYVFFDFPFKYLVRTGSK